MLADERERRTEEIYSGALKLDPRVRAEYLMQACGDDSDLRHEIESLLGYEEKLGGFLEPGATGATEATPADQIVMSLWLVRRSDRIPSCRCWEPGAWAWSMRPGTPSVTCASLLRRWLTWIRSGFSY